MPPFCILLQVLPAALKAMGGGLPHVDHYLHVWAGPDMVTLAHVTWFVAEALQGVSGRGRRVGRTQQHMLRCVALRVNVRHMPAPSGVAAQCSACQACWQVLTTSR
jgi:hypothetical protein